MSFFKNKGQEGKQVLSGGWHQWEGGGHTKECRRVNMVEILCMKMEKMRPVETILRMGEGIKE
jgi:hypothetical protein